MTDRGLLELAAKAAGVRGFWVDAGFNVGSDAEPLIWNPLTDDGDALRLAVKLRMGVEITASLHWTSITFYRDPWAGENYKRRPYVHETHNYDPYAATRRAIVRAAAAIGRTFAAQEGDK